MGRFGVKNMGMVKLMREPTFTDDWTTRNFPVWRDLLSKRQGIKVILEVGSWEGRSALFWLEHVPECQLTCIDAWSNEDAPTIDGNKFTPAQVAKGEDNFNRNVIWSHENRVAKIKARSTEALARLNLTKYWADLIYIDAGHLAHEVYADATLAWPLLRTHGIMIFDDFRWDRSPTVGDHCGYGVDAFLGLHTNEYKTLHDGFQMIVEKLT